MKTFADAAARYAYYVRPEDVNTEFKQTDNSSVYIATRQGAGAQAWEFSYTVGDGAGGLSDGDYGDVTVSESGSRMLLRGLAVASGMVTATIGTDQNNYAIAATTSVVAVDPSAAFTFTGFDDGTAGGVPGRAFLLQNVSDGGGALPFYIAHQSASSNAFFCRVKLPNATRLVVRPGEGVWLRLVGLYWQPVGIVRGDGQQTLADAATITLDASIARNATVTMSDNRVLDIVNVTSGERGVLRVIQDAAETVRQFTAIRLNGSVNNVWMPGGAAALATFLVAANEESDVLEWFYDGAQLLVWSVSAATAFQE